MLFLLATASMAGCAREDPGKLLTFDVPKNSEPRKELIVDGVLLHGRIDARFEHGRTTLNGIELIPVPIPRGPVSPFDPYDTTGISGPVLEWLAKVPLVQRRMREGWTEPRAIREFYGKADSQLVLVTRVYRASVGSGPEFAARMARAVIDSELAVADSAGEHSPQFGIHGADLYFHGYGWTGLMGYTGETHIPSPRQTAERMKSGGLETVKSIRNWLLWDGPTLILCTRGSMFMCNGTDALVRFGDLDRLRNAGTPSARRRLLSSTRFQPQELDELEAGGYFRTSPGLAEPLR